MKRKIIVLSVILTLLINTAFAQSPERIQDRASSNLKDLPEKARALYNKAIDYFNKKEYQLAIHNYEMARYLTKANATSWSA